MCRLICNLPELNIRIFLIRLLPIADLQVCFSDRRSLYLMLSDSISDRTLLLLFLNCITTMHMNFSLFTLRSSLNLWHIRQNISFADSLQQFPTKFCITTKHLDFSLFTFRFSLTHAQHIQQKNILWIHNNDRIHKIFVLNL